ncbi:MAG: hypothetical protein JO349_04830 [Candidatus Eremiobacteraeota bacterium]|nr:hypothetical protein [Candidatus Eremiobacteraeota bacterium]
MLAIRAWAIMPGGMMRLARLDNARARMAAPIATIAAAPNAKIQALAKEIAIANSSALTVTS